MEPVCNPTYELEDDCAEINIGNSPANLNTVKEEECTPLGVLAEAEDEASGDLYENVNDIKDENVGIPRDRNFVEMTIPILPRSSSEPYRKTSPAVSFRSGSTVKPKPALRTKPIMLKKSSVHSTATMKVTPSSTKPELQEMC